MIKKVLVADYGEVAVGLLWEFKRAGIKTVAFYTVHDSNSEHVRVSDEIICIGDTPKSCYIDWQGILRSAWDGRHPTGPIRPLSRPTDTLSPAPNGGEGWGEGARGLVVNVGDFSK
jgi:hypothetical protein